MSKINYLKNIINNRTVCLMAHGASIKQLETHIYDLKDKDICWVSLGVFDMMEEYILSRINKHLSIIFDCATVPHARTEHYEKMSRIPRLEPFLKRNEDNLWITSHGLIRDSVKLYYNYFLDEFNDKILQVDDLFPPHEISKWMDVPNSITLFIGALLAGNAKQIIIFGLDGYLGEIYKGIDSYYKPDLIRIERQIALGSDQDPGINRDTKGFEERFLNIFKSQQNLFNNFCPIFNCSPSSLYEMIPKINYSQLKDYV